MSADTIVVIATAAGRGAVGIVRVSGPATGLIMMAVCGRRLSPRTATRLSFLDGQGQSIDDGIAIFFPGPHSYTGEDVLELQGHGGTGVMSALLKRCLRVQPSEDDGQGSRIRLAEPGEFTQRAFLNDKLDLAQAEAVADLINAGSERAARSALASLQGRFSDLVHSLVAKLTDLRVRVEACLDFPEEDLEFIEREEVSKRLAEILALHQDISHGAQQGAVLRDGLRVVLVGAPNVGKSSLLNALAGEEVALVTDIAGTTRDRIVQEVLLEGLSVHMIDTAGLRETQDEVERLGIARTWAEIERAQVVLLLRDATARVAIDRIFENEVLARAPSGCSVIEVVNKSDLLVSQDVLPALEGDERVVASRILISAKTGFGLSELRQQLLTAAGLVGESSVGIFSARTRHLQALVAARLALHQAAEHLRQRELELLAEGLRQAQQALTAITGEFSADDLLGEIFGSFCIGK